jgi:hypothetical protein
VTVRGVASYRDTYVEVGETWLIQETERTDEELWPRTSLAGLRITADRWATGGRSSLL